MTSQEIHDMIQTFPLEDATHSPQFAASAILDILDALNRRMDGIEAAVTSLQRINLEGPNP